MARQITIPIEATGDCVEYYLGEYKLTGDVGYIHSQQFFTTPIVFNNLLDNTIYDIRITRYCCGGASSTPQEFTIDTTVVAAPASITPTQDGADVDVTWSTVTGADAYQLQRAESSDFTVNLVELYEGAATAYTDTGLSAGTYWYRARAHKAGASWSAWVSNNIVVT